MISIRGTVAGLDQRIGLPRTFVPKQRRGVVMLYGATGTRDAWFAWDQTLHPDGEITGITDAGFPLGSIDTLDYWGNETIRDNVTQLRDNNADLWGGIRVHLIGASAGGLTVLNWAKENPELVRSITLLIPVLDVQDVYDNDRGGFASVVSAAYGGRPPDAENPASNYASFAGIPIHLYYSTNDFITPNSINEDFISGVGSVEAVSMGALGHFWSLDYWNPESIVSFLEAHD